MRADVQIIFKATPCDKQTMMFSATLSKEIRPICKLFMQDVSLCRVSMSCSIYTVAGHQAEREITRVISPPSALRHVNETSVHLYCSVAVGLEVPSVT